MNCCMYLIQMVTSLLLLLSFLKAFSRKFSTVQFTHIIENIHDSWRWLTRPLIKEYLITFSLNWAIASFTIFPVSALKLKFLSIFITVRFSSAVACTVLLFHSIMSFTKIQYRETPNFFIVVHLTKFMLLSIRNIFNIAAQYHELSSA